MNFPSLKKTYPRSGEPEVSTTSMPLKDIPSVSAIPFDTEVVHLSGSENIYGSKFFRDQTYFGDSISYTSLKSNGDITWKPSGSNSINTYSLPDVGGELSLRYKIITPVTTTSTTSATDDTISTTLHNAAVNVVSAGQGTDYIILTFPDKKEGYARDFFVRLVLTGTDVPVVSCCEPTGGPVEFDVDDDSWNEIDLGVNLFMFTETSQTTPSS